MIIPQLNTDMDKTMQSLPETGDQADRKPDEQSGLHVQGHIKIF